MPGKTDPIQAFDEAVERYQQRGMTKIAAVKAVAKKDPALHQAYLQKVNAGRPLARIHGPG